MSNILTDEQRAWIESGRSLSKRGPVVLDRIDWIEQLRSALSIIDTLTAALDAERGKVGKHAPRTMGEDRQWRSAPTEHRIETGAVRFGDDWPGLFIRGDNAAGLLGAIQAALYDEGRVKGSGNWFMVLGWMRDLQTMIARDVIIQPSPEPGADHAER